MNIQRLLLLTAGIFCLTLFFDPSGFARPLNSVVDRTSGDEAVILVGSRPVTVELAITQQDKQQGLMYRESLETDHGMLFVLDREHPCFWMKNTYMDLDLAFIDQNGHINGIRRMKAESLDPVCSIESAAYALEMESGWFEANHIAEGVLVQLER